MLAIIQWELVGEVIAVSFVAGLGVVALFALVILGSTRAADARRAGSGAAATAFSALAIAAFVAFMGVAVFAILVMTQKG